jgi:hypothetical protein
MSSKLKNGPLYCAVSQLLRQQLYGEAVSSGDLVFVPSVFRTLKRPFLMVKTVVAGPNLSALKLPYLAALGIDCVLRY